MDFKANSCVVVNDMHPSGGANKAVGVQNLPAPAFFGDGVTQERDRT